MTLELQDTQIFTIYDNCGDAVVLSQQETLKAEMGAIEYIEYINTGISFTARDAMHAENMLYEPGIEHAISVFYEGPDY